MDVGIDGREDGGSAAIGVSRLAVGLTQGLAAWLLIRGADKPWANAHPQFFAGLVMVAAFVPLIVLAGIGVLRPRTLIAWIAMATLSLLLLAAYDLWREPVQTGFSQEKRHWPSQALIVFSAAALYIAHHLIEPADVQRSFSPTYQGRFESAWRHAFQLVLSLLFTVVVWGVLELGAELLDLIGVKFIKELLQKTWFVSPVLACAFAGAVHITDVRPALIRGLRLVGMTLLAWLLPLMTGLAALFLGSLFATGVHPLWATNHAASILLSASGVLILLLNAAYQDGQGVDALPPPLRWAGRLAALLLAPLVVLAAWSLAMRSAQYGLTPRRVVSFAVLAVSLAYAGGYGWSALSRGAWMRPLERVNVLAAYLMLALSVLLLSPMADPVRISVADQVERLNSGRTPPAGFDFNFLRFDAARFGSEALARLSRTSRPDVANRAAKTLALTSRVWPVSPNATSTEPPFSHAVLRGAAPLPASFRAQAWIADGQTPQCLISGEDCDLLVRDLDRDGRPEVLVAEFGQLIAFRQAADGQWRRWGSFTNAGCPAVRAALQRSEIQSLKPQVDDLEIGGQGLSFQSESPCRSRVSHASGPMQDPAPSTLGPAFARPNP